MPGKRENVLGHGFLRAAGRGMNLCCAGVVATAGLVFQSWTIFGVSIAGYAGMIILDLSRLGFWKRVLDDLRSRPALLPDPEVFTDPAARQLAHRVHQARAELARVIDWPRAAFPARTTALLEVVPDMEKRAIGLLRRLEDLSRYLADKNLRGLAGDVERLRKAAEGGASVPLRLAYQKAHFARREEVQALEEITAAKDLILARLETVVGTLEMFPCEVMRARVADAGLRDQTEDAPFDPRLLTADAASYDQVLATVVEPTEVPTATGNGN